VNHVQHGASRRNVNFFPRWIHGEVLARGENRVDARWRDADRTRVPHPSSRTDRVTTVRLARRMYHMIHLVLTNVQFRLAG